MKCDICKDEIEEHFLHKLKGSYVKINGKTKTVCNSCQSKYKDDIKKEL